MLPTAWLQVLQVERWTGALSRVFNRERERKRKGKQNLLSTATSLEPFAEDCCLPWLWCSASTVALLDRIVMFSLISLSMKEDQEFGNFKGLDSKLKFFY